MAPPASRARPLAFVLALLLARSTAADEGAGRSAELEQVLTRLAERAAIYEHTALRFACQEEADATTYGGQEEIKKQEHEVHDYLLEYTEENGFRPYRALLSRDGKPKPRREVDPDYPIPPPYAWNLLFSAGRQVRFHFQLVEKEIVSPFLTWVIEFKPVLPYNDGSRIDEWEGKVWVDQDTLDVVRVEAEPGNEAETLEARIAEYRQSFRVLGIGTRTRPRARRLEVEFGHELEGLRFPSRATLTTRIANSLEDRRLESSVVLRYGNYVFYGTEEIEEFHKLRGTRSP